MTTYLTPPRDPSGRYSPLPEVGIARAMTEALRRALGYPESIVEEKGLGSIARRVIGAVTFDPTEHPRDVNGRFIEKGSHVLYRGRRATVLDVRDGKVVIDRIGGAPKPVSPDDVEVSGRNRPGRGGKVSDKDRLTAERLLTFTGDGYTSKVTAVKATHNGWQATVDVHAEDGSLAGQGIFYAQARANGELDLNIDALYMSSTHQGHGFGRGYTKHIVDVAQGEGFDSLSLVADVDVGGYAWAMRGFDWYGDRKRNSREWTRLAARLRTVAATVEDEDVAEEMLAAAEHLAASAQDRALPPPTPADIAEIGKSLAAPDPRRHGVPMWPGKRVMLGSMWEGVLRLSPTPGTTAIAPLPLDGRRDATGSMLDPIDVGDDLDKARTLLAEGRHIRVDQPEMVSSMLSRLTAGTFDLGKVAIPGTNLFSEATRGIPRPFMPQLIGRARPGSAAADLPRLPSGNVSVEAEFIDALRDRGIAVTSATMPASHLRPTQDGLSSTTVNVLLAKMQAASYYDAPIFVTRDGYIIDGHHRWAALVAFDAQDGVLGDVELPVQVIDLDVGAAIDFAAAFADAMGVEREPLEGRS